MTDADDLSFEVKQVYRLTLEQFKCPDRWICESNTDWVYITLTTNS